MLTATVDRSTVDTSTVDLTVAIPVLALVFTLASFWWIWLRRGRLHSPAPLAYASAITQQLRIRFPLVLHNTGATPIIVENLRMLIDGQDLEWLTIRRTLRPQPDDTIDFPAPFVVAGREALQLFAEFGGNSLSWAPELGRGYPVTIERLTRGRWKTVVSFTWWSPMNEPGGYIPHRNRPPAS